MDISSISARGRLTKNYLISRWCDSIMGGEICSRFFCSLWRQKMWITLKGLYGAECLNLVEEGGSKSDAGLGGQPKSPGETSAHRISRNTGPQTQCKCTQLQDQKRTLVRGILIAKASATWPKQARRHGSSLLMQSSPVREPSPVWLSSANAVMDPSFSARFWSSTIKPISWEYLIFILISFQSMAIDIDIYRYIDIYIKHSYSIFIYRH